MRATKIRINTMSIDCPHCEHGSLLSRNTDSYDIEPNEINGEDSFYCGDCGQSSKIASKILRIVGK